MRHGIGRIQCGVQHTWQHMLLRTVACCLLYMSIRTAHWVVHADLQGICKDACSALLGWWQLLQLHTGGQDNPWMVTCMLQAYLMVTSMYLSKARAYSHLHTLFCLLVAWWQALQLQTADNLQQHWDSGESLRTFLNLRAPSITQCTSCIRPFVPIHAVFRRLYELVHLMLYAL